MLPPVLEIYVVWHPNDVQGEATAELLIEHFHGTSFSGLIGGAIEVYIRSKGWRSNLGSPRPIPFENSDVLGGVRPSEFIAVVPILGNELASALEKKDPEWTSYIESIANTKKHFPDRVGIFPFLLNFGVLNNTLLGEILGEFQQVAASVPDPEGDTKNAMLCRDLAQGIAQSLSSSKDRLMVFLSHTKHARPGGEEDTSGLISIVRNIIGSTRLNEFFDANDLQPGCNWDEKLRENASKGALLGIRTDLYPSREWCQREVRIAKQHGMPVIILDAPSSGEERGSYLMDHVPRMPISKDQGTWNKKDIYRALNLLVDECLKRVLWFHQERIATKENAVEVSWWAPHAPEPVTLISWLAEQRKAKKWPNESNKNIVILHPDPPLGPDEKLVLNQILEVAGIEGEIDVMTPRILAARGG